jgi:hypothetical protein
MEKKTTLFILLFFIGSFLKAQTGFDLYGIAFSYNSISGNRTTAFTRIDPENGNLSLLSTWKYPNIYAFGSQAMDPRHKIFYQTTTDPWNMFILKIDMNTGIVMDTVFSQDSIGAGDTSGTSWISNEISGLLYNCSNDHIYFLYNTKNKDIDNSSTDGTRLAKIDAVTGKVSLVTILPDYFFASGQQYCDPMHQKIILYKNMDSNLYTYDLVTNKVSSLALSKKYNDKQGYSIIFNKNDGQLYGIEFDYTTFADPTYVSKCKMIKINPITGLVSDLSASFDFNGSGFMYLEPSNGKLYVLGQVASGTPQRLFIFDIHTNLMSSYPDDNIPGTTLFTGIYGISNLSPDTAFTYKNLCQHVATEFYPTTSNGSIEWDFGDPASGDLNSSYEPNSHHIYANPGSYEVKMISSSCLQSNTTIKQIVIEPFPKIDLGNDTLWCINKKQNDMLLTVNAPSASYLWQDQSTSNLYTVKQPGLYWVKVTTSFCEVKDSLIVEPASCPCHIRVTPTLTHSSVSFIFDCDLSTYDHIYTELYDERAQLVLCKDMEESDNTINLEPLTAGIYFYRIRDKNSILKSGKVVFVK